MAESKLVLEVEERLTATCANNEKRRQEQEAKRLALLVESHRARLRQVDAQHHAQRSALERDWRKSEARAAVERELLRSELARESEERLAKFVREATKQGEGFSQAALEEAAAPLIAEADAKSRERELKAKALCEQAEKEASALRELARTRIAAAEQSRDAESARASELKRALDVAQPALVYACEALRRLRAEEARRVAVETEAIERKVKLKMGMAKDRLLQTHGPEGHDAGQARVEGLIESIATEEKQALHAKAAQAARTAAVEMQRRVQEAEERGQQAGIKDKEEAVRAAVTQALKDASQRSEVGMAQVVAVMAEKLHRSAPEAVQQLVAAKCDPLAKRLGQAQQEIDKLRERLAEVGHPEPPETFKPSHPESPSSSKNAESRNGNGDASKGSGRASDNSLLGWLGL